MRSLLGLASALLLLVPGGDGEGDQVVLKSGKALLGRVVFQDRTSLVLRQDRHDKVIQRREIERVESRWHNLDALLDNAAKADLEDVKDVELLALQAEEMGLDGEAQVFWWRILLLDREHAGARRALGHVKRGRDWDIPLEGRMLDWDKRFELAGDWGSAWELHSLHYSLRSNLPLRSNLDILLDLERLYRAFYELFGDELRIFDVCRPMNVGLHADSASYPESANEIGRYDYETDILHLNVSAGLDFGTLAHEATHQLLYDTAFSEKNGDGEIPPWLNEGLAEYMAGSVVKVPELQFDPGRTSAHHFRNHADAKNPLDLTRVLSLSSSDYYSSSDGNLKYAQSYGLVHFLLHAREGRYRAGFLEFLRSVYAGKGSATDLKRCLRVEWRELEVEWHEYARQKAQ